MVNASLDYDFPNTLVFCDGHINFMLLAFCDGSSWLNSMRQIGDAPVAIFEVFCPLHTTGT
jgi:hypothetical protein